jgi:accessory gene regulator protein AgrB
MNLCQYKNILGKVGEGAHSLRFMGVAIVDVLLTILGSYLLSSIFHWNFWITLIAVFILGIILHRVFCVRTTIDKLLFPNVTE